MSVLYNVSYEDLMQYMDQNDKKKMIHFIDLLNNVLIGVAITSDGVLKHHTYPLLTRLVGVATLNTDCIGSAPGVEETYSIVCREEYDKLCSFIQEYQLPYQKVCPDVFVILSIKYLRKYIRQDEESPDFERMAFLLADGSHNCDETEFDSAEPVLGLPRTRGAVVSRDWRKASRLIQ